MNADTCGARFSTGNCFLQNCVSGAVQWSGCSYLFHTDGPVGPDVPIGPGWPVTPCRSIIHIDNQFYASYSNHCETSRKLSIISENIYDIYFFTTIAMISLASSIAHYTLQQKNKISSVFILQDTYRVLLQIRESDWFSHCLQFADRQRSRARWTWRDGRC